MATRIEEPFICVAKQSGPYHGAEGGIMTRRSCKYLEQCVLGVRGIA